MVQAARAVISRHEQRRCPESVGGSAEHSTLERLLRSGARFAHSAVVLTANRRGAGAGLQGCLSRRRRLSGRYRSSAGQDLYIGDGDQGNQRCASAIRRGRLFAQSTLERMVRDARMFTIGGGTAQISRTVVASRLLGRKLPQSRDGHVAKTGSE